MKKQIRMLLAFGIIMCLSISSSFIVLAGEWKQDTTGWWYVEEDGSSYPINQWKWIDDDKDNIGECYYFGENGYLVTSATIDGYFVNGEGAWIVDGVVQSKIMKKEKYFAEKRTTHSEEKIEEAKEVLCNVGRDSYYEDNYPERKEAIYNYFEALGFEAKNLSFTKNGIKYQNKTRSKEILSTKPEEDIKDPFYELLMANNGKIWNLVFDYVKVAYTYVRNEDGEFSEERILVVGIEDENEDGYATNIINEVELYLEN